MAVGQANGRISLRSFDYEHVLKELSPRTVRTVNDLSWSPVHTNLLGAGYEKTRGDGAVLVFDVEKSATVGPITTG